MSSPVSPLPTVQWRSVSAASVISTISLGIAILALNSSYTAKQERQDARIDALEEGMKVRDERYKSAMITLAELNNKFPTMTFRVEQAETSIENLRNLLFGMRDDLYDIKISLEVLTEQMRQERAMDRQPPAPPPGKRP